MSGNNPVNHINYPVEGRIYCRKVHNVVCFNMRHVNLHCSSCDLFAGSAQGEGVECYWEDPRADVYTPHIVTDPYEEYESIRAAEGHDGRKGR